MFGFPPENNDHLPRHASGQTNASKTETRDRVSATQKLEDPLYSGWFVAYDPAKQSHPNAPPCDLHRANVTERCSKLYHDQRETPEAFAYCANATNTPPSCDPTAAGNFVNGARQRLSLLLRSNWILNAGKTDHLSRQARDERTVGVIT